MRYILDVRMRDTKNKPQGAEEITGDRGIPYWRREYRESEIADALAEFVTAAKIENEVILKATNYVSGRRVLRVRFDIVLPF